jgi:osomolarity two-component system sensor histidine kinase SLN1
MLKLEDVYDVVIAKDGQEAYDVVKQSMEEGKFFNLIFMDIQVSLTVIGQQITPANLCQMPNLDGLQSTRLIREMGYSAPIVALTAFAEESNVKECYESGMNHFLRFVTYTFVPSCRTNMLTVNLFDVLHSNKC